MCRCKGVSVWPVPNFTFTPQKKKKPGGNSCMKFLHKAVILSVCKIIPGM